MHVLFLIPGGQLINQTQNTGGKKICRLIKNIFFILLVDFTFNHKCFIQLHISFLETCLFKVLMEEARLPPMECHINVINTIFNGDSG